MTYTVTINRPVQTDPRLGRRVNHDSRSRMYAFPAQAEALVSVKHERMIPVLDQGNLGSCTGNAAVGALGTQPLYEPLKERTLDEELAVHVYSVGTTFDSDPRNYPPDDTGSDGLSVAKACKALGYISGYQWAFDLNSALSALQKYPVITGLNWYDSMFEPARDGRLTISGGIAGGHEIVIDEIDVLNRRVWLTNSWGDYWGLNGRAYLTWEDWERLLSEQGDVTVLLPLTVSPPDPQPQPDPVPADAAFSTAAHKWLDSHPCFYRTFKKAVQDWLTAKGL